MLSYRFRRSQRLLEKTAFQHVFDQPCKSSDRYFVILARHNNLAQARLGLAITRKRVKRATERNRLKRLARETFRYHQYILAGLDCIVLARDGVDQVENRILLHSLTKHWQKLAQRCKKS
jgi:ribonuclease P protein component